MKPWQGLAAALVLGGCVVSEQPLFDPINALTPAKPGRYEQQELRDGKWVKLRAGSLTLSGNTYQWKADGEQDAPRFTVYEASSDYFTLHAELTEQGKTRQYYALVKPTPDGYLFYQVLCSDFRKLDVRIGLRPKKIVGSDCFFDDDAALSAALIAYAKAMQPEFRYVRTGDLAAAPRPAPRLRSPGFSAFPFIGSPRAEPGAQPVEPSR
jgi:hypothetical protein